MATGSDIAQAAAYHVAGHALIAWRLGWLPATVELTMAEPEAPGACPCHAERWLPQRPGKSAKADAIRQFYRSAAQLLHGGFIAQAMVDADLRDGSAEERRVSMACVRTMVSLAGTDHESATDTNDGVPAQVADVDDEIVLIVCKHAQGIERFASALLKEPHVSASMAASLLRGEANGKRRQASRRPSIRDEPEWQVAGPSGVGPAESSSRVDPRPDRKVRRIRGPAPAAHGPAS